VSSTIPQPVVAQLTRAAIFLVVSIKPEPECDDRGVRGAGAGNKEVRLASVGVSSARRLPRSRAGHLVTIESE
jgi:hypothetical protein